MESDSESSCPQEKKERGQAIRNREKGKRPIVKNKKTTDREFRFKPVQRNRCWTAEKVNCGRGKKKGEFLLSRIRPRSWNIILYNSRKRASDPLKKKNPQRRVEIVHRNAAEKGKTPKRAE